jgi:hypothetical protein
MKCGGLLELSLGWDLLDWTVFTSFAVRGGVWSQEICALGNFASGMNCHVWTEITFGE